MPALRREQKLAVAIRALAVCRLRASGFGDSGNDFPGYADAPDGLVPRDVVDDEPEERNQCPRPLASSRLGQLPAGLGLLAQTAASHDPTRAGTTLGQRGGGRSLSGGLEEGRRGRGTESKALIVVAVEEDEYCEKSRTHLGLAKDAPIPRPVQPPSLGRVIALPQVGGLHHRYECRAA